MSSRQKIKVRVADLIDKIEETAAQREAEYQSALAQYEADVKTYGKRLSDWLTAKARECKADPFAINRGRWGDFWDGAPETPSKPSKPASRQHVIDQLRMSADDTISITAADFAAYIN